MREIEFKIQFPLIKSMLEYILFYYFRYFPQYYKFLFQSPPMLSDQSAGYDPNESYRHSQVEESASKGGEYAQDRQYGCPCGKFYKSAAALYTHVKFKHNGTAPGPLIKPVDKRKTKNRGLEHKIIPRKIRNDFEVCREQPSSQKSRLGRPTISVQAVEEDSDCPFDVCEQVCKLLFDVSVSADLPFQSSNGTQTCQDIVSKFMEDLAGISPDMMKTVRYFLNFLKEFLCDDKRPDYWYKKEAKIIVSSANEFIRKFKTYKEESELSKEKVIDLTHLLCRWMYRRKWTTDKLLKRAQAKIVVSQ